MRQTSMGGVQSGYTEVWRDFPATFFLSDARGMIPIGQTRLFFESKIQFGPFLNQCNRVIPDLGSNLVS